MRSGQAVAGRIRFRDLQYRRDAEFVVNADSVKGEITLFLDQDVEATGGFYAGECLVAMEAEDAVRLIRLLQTSTKRLSETGDVPNVVGRAPFKWSDSGGPGPTDPGIIVLASSGRIMLGIPTGEESIGDAYIATFDCKTGEDLVNALSRGVSAMAPQGQSI